MAHWKIKAVKEAQTELYELSTEMRTRIREMLRKETCREYPCGEFLAGCPGWYSIRVGKYRLVYAPYHDEVHIMLVTAVGLHEDVYREIHRRYDKYGR